MVARLIGDKTLAPDRIGEGGAAFLLRETEEEKLSMLEERLNTACAAAAAVIDACLDRIPGEG
jgi:glutamate-ammonia-ligase adenylyltransferase